MTSSLLLGGCGVTSMAMEQQTLTSEQNWETIEATTGTSGQNRETVADTGASQADAAKQEPVTDEVPTEAEPEPQPEEVSIIMVGDVLLHTNVNNSGLQEDGTYNYDHLFAQVKDDIEEADLALVNQEVILGGTELKLSGYPAFNGAYEVGDALVDAGFDVILHATNHALDKGKKGILNCLHFWKENYPDVGVVGLYETEEERNQIYVKEINGIRVAILNYTYGTNGIKPPSDMPYTVNYLQEQLVRTQIAQAEDLADFTIVCPHWGTEYELGTSADQRKWAKIFAEEGADLVIGTHPHVIEPIEWVETQDGHRMLVYYSLGNFINSTSGTKPGAANRMCGGMARVTLVRNEAGEVELAEYDVEPLVTQMLTGTGRITTYRFSDYTRELAEENEMRKQDKSFSYDYCEQLFEKVWGDLLVD